MDLTGRPGGLVVVVVVALLAGQVGGCSLIGVTPPPSNPAPGRVIRCDESRAAPVIEVSMAALSGGGGAWLLLVSELAGDGGEPRSHTWSRAAGAGLLVLAAVSAFSAYYGFTRTARCRELRGGRGPW